MGYVNDTPRTSPRARHVSRVRVENGGTNLGAITTAAITPPTTTTLAPANTGQLAPSGGNIVVPTTTPTSGVPASTPTTTYTAYAKGYGVIVGSNGVEYTHVASPLGWSTWKSGQGTSFIPENAAPSDVLAIWRAQNAGVQQPPPPPPPSAPTDTGGSAVDTDRPRATDVAAAAAPFIAPFSPAAAAVSALAPAVSSAMDAGPFTSVKFDDAQIYDEDGTPVTTAAKTATFIDKLNALPPMAKLGGVVLLAILLTRSKR